MPADTFALNVVHTVARGRPRENYGLLVAIGSVAMLALMVLKPLNYDSQLYQAMALELYRFGKVPFIGTFDQNFPGIVYLHYIGILFFGTSDLSIRIFDFILQASFALLLYRFWSRWLQPKTAAVAALLYIAMYVAGGGLLLAERDVYGAMLLVASLHLLLKAREKHAAGAFWTFVAGLIAGIGFVIRPTALLQLAIVAIAILYSRSSRSVLRPAIFAVTSMIPIAIVLAYYATIPGGLSAFCMATIRFNLDVYTQLNSGIDYLLNQMARRALLIPLILYALLRRWEWPQYYVFPPSRFERRVYVTVTISLLLTAFYMRKYYDYHFVPFYIFSMPLVAMACQSIAGRFRSVLTRHYALLAVCFLATFAAYAPKTPFAAAVGAMIGKNPIDFAYHIQYQSPTLGAVPELAAIGYLNAPEHRQGKVEVCSFDPRFRLHLGRDCVGRYISLLPLALAKGVDVDKPVYTDYQIQWRADYLATIAHVKPRYLILARETHGFYFLDCYRDLLTHIPGFDSTFHALYQPDTTFGGFQIYRLKAGN